MFYVNASGAGVIVLPGIHSQNYHNGDVCELNINPVGKKINYSLTFRIPAPTSTNPLKMY
jgi:hypothetical protein